MCIDYKGCMFQHGLKVAGVRLQKARADGIGRENQTSLHFRRSAY